MKKFIIPVVISSLLIGGLFGAKGVLASADTANSIDCFYDSEFVMESGMRLTTNKELSYHGFMHRSSFNQIKKEYTNLTFTTVVYPTYYIEEYGKVNEDSLFGSDAKYTLDPNEAGKVALTKVESTIAINNHNVEIVGNYDVSLYGSIGVEYTGVTIMQAELYGAKVVRFATANNNSNSLISLAEEIYSNPFYEQELKDTASEIIDDFKLNAEDFNYHVETYVNNTRISNETYTAKYGMEVTAEVNPIEGYSFLRSKSITKGIVLANDKLVLKLYYTSNPTYKIGYYVMDGDANYVLCKQVSDLTTNYYNVITLTDEEKKLPADVELPVPGYKDDYVFSSSDSIVSGVNDGNLELKVCFSLSSRIVSNMKRSNGVYNLTKQLDNSVPCGYLMCGFFAKTAIFSVNIPVELITYGGAQPIGGITFTNGETLTAKEGTRKPGDWIAMDVALHVKGLKTSNNINGGVGRCAEVNDAPQCKELYYDKTVNVATNPVMINDRDHALTVVLAEDVFYVYIDDQFVTRFVCGSVGNFFMPRDSQGQPRFVPGSSYMFGVFMGCWASTSSKITTLKEVYDDEAKEEIKSNERYSNITLSE